MQVGGFVGKATPNSARKYAEYVMFSCKETINRYLGRLYNSYILAQKNAIYEQQLNTPSNEE